VSDSFDLSELVVDPEDVGTPGIHKTSVYQYNISFYEIQNDLDAIRDEAIRILKEKKYFKTPRRKRMREGFIDVSLDGDVIKSTFAKENPTKIVYVTEDLELLKQHIALVNTGLVKSCLYLSPNMARIVTFGGNDAIIKKTVGGLQTAMLGRITGGYKDIQKTIPQKDMVQILRNMENATFLVIDPGDSERFIKSVQKSGKEEIEYKVYANFRGTRINMSPIVTELIEEEGIRIRQIQGRMNLGVTGITTKIYARGKIEFIIPENIIPKGQLPQDIAEMFYHRVLQYYGG